MFKDIYPTTFSHQMEAIVFIIFQIVLATRSVLKIGEYSRIFPSFSLRIFCYVSFLDQSHARENISWMIIPSVRWNIQSRNAFRPIAGERKYMMYSNARIFLSFCWGIFSHVNR